MSIQNLINVASSLEINRRKVVSQQMTRSDVVKVGETPTRNPWKMTVGLSVVKPYATARALMESVDYYDRSVYQDISFSSNAKLSYMFAYQGNLNLGQLNNLRVSSFSGNQLQLSGLPAGNAGSYIVRAGDIFTINNLPYPFTSVNDVQRGNDVNVTITTNRPNFLTSSVVNTGLQFGNGVVFRMIASAMPTYKLIPGGGSALVQFTGDLQLVEYTGDA
jgi:hypothetical protein